MTGTLRQVAPAVVEPREDAAASFRDRIASRCAKHDAMFPRAVNLEALVLVGMHSKMTGSVTSLSGIHSPRRFRESTLGERHLHLADLCRLATDPTREGRAAARAAITELAYAVGCSLEPLATNEAEAHETLAGVMETAGDFGGEMTRALRNDGLVDAVEAGDIEPKLDALDAMSARARALLARAREGRR